MVRPASVPLFCLGLCLSLQTFAQDYFYDDPVDPAAPPARYKIAIDVPCYLGNASRNYYGQGPVPAALKVLWEKFTGRAETLIWKEKVEMAGTGWPDQPVLVRENGTQYLLFGSLNHVLYKVNARNGQTVWEHRFDDAIKGTPLLYVNPRALTAREKGMVFCGSRRRLMGRSGNYRALSLMTGEELWSFSVPGTESYSRDVDSDGLLVRDVLYLPAENGFFYVFDPDPSKALPGPLHREPLLLSSLKLYRPGDIKKFKNNMVLESSASYRSNRIYLSASFGYVFGIDRSTCTKVWEHFIGADIDSTPVITRDGYLLVGTEKQYVDQAGVYKLDPRVSGEKARVWFFPVKKTNFASWEGGVIGSVAVNDQYNDGEDPSLCAFTSLDGFLYVLDQATGRLVWKENIGPSISTPVFLGRTIVAGGYSCRLHVFSVDYEKAGQDRGAGIVHNREGRPFRVRIRETAAIDLEGEIESTPLVWENRIYVGCRNGSFYCIGPR